MAAVRFFRYLAPNLITLSSMIFGLVSLRAASRADWALAAWMIIYAVLTDRLDGLVARAVKGTSELGAQLDSFADFLNFGVAPAFLVITYLTSRPDLPFNDGAPHTFLFIACGGYMLCAVFRLARYNIQSDDAAPTKIFFGFPTTLAGGLLAIWMLLLLKYDPSETTFGGSKLFGESFTTPVAAWKYFPIAVAVLGYLMASRLPMPKVGMTKNKAVSVILLALLALGYVCGFAMMYPEICFWMPTVWSITFLIWGQASASWRAMYPPPLFPRKAPPQPVIRAQADIEDLVLDESPGGASSTAASAGGPTDDADTAPAKPDVP
ncbi:MAG: CDP-alcohol phosphatidyltransferase family protein [Deltaproteobacteria bacterium]|nr:CDP-alcohol phosphatidyltransferase family protein [Deltaproteobacteria bacterium]